MSNLPKWMKELKKGANCGKAYDALAIAWEALEKIQNHGQQDCSKSVGNAEDAMGRIAELGGRKHSSTNQFTGICPHCGKAHTNPLKCECLLCVTWRKAAKK